MTFDTLPLDCLREIMVYLDSIFDVFSIMTVNKLLYDFFHESPEYACQNVTFRFSMFKGIACHEIIRNYSGKKLPFVVNLKVQLNYNRKLDLEYFEMFFEKFNGIRRLFFNPSDSKSPDTLSTKIMKNLKNLTHMEFLGTSRLDNYEDLRLWKNVVEFRPKTIQKEMFDHLHSENIKKLHFTGRSKAPFSEFMDSSILQKFINLEELRLNSVFYFKDEAFKNCTKLKLLQIGLYDGIQSQLTEEAFQYMKNLEDLILSGTRNEPFKGNGEGFRYLKNLRRLTFGRYSYFRTNMLKYLGNLESLHLGNGVYTTSKYPFRKVQNDGFENLTNLRELQLYQQTRLSNEIIFPYYKKLRKLVLYANSFSSHISRDRKTGFEHLVNLEILHVTSHWISDKIFKYVKKLRELEIRGCNAFRDEGFADLKDVRVLKSVKFDNCSSLSSKVFRFLPFVEDMRITKMEKCNEVDFDHLVSLKSLDIQIVKTLSPRFIYRLKNLRKVLIRLQNEKFMTESAFDEIHEYIQSSNGKNLESFRFQKVGKEYYGTTLRNRFEIEKFFRQKPFGKCLVTKDRIKRIFDSFNGLM